MMEFIRDYGLILIFFILPVVFVIQPLFLPNVEEKKSPLDRPELKRKKLILYRQIKELEMEFKETEKTFDPKKVYKDEPNPTKL